MKVILIKDVESLGKKGDCVEVSGGYGRNFLLPKQLAISATNKNIQMVEREKGITDLREKKRIREAIELSKKLKKVEPTIVKPVGDNKRLFGTVTTADIAEALEKEGLEVDKKKIIIDEPIKTLGIYNISVKLHPEVDGKFKIWVVEQ
jgi:large subunit ribosomal protein L9